MLKNTSVKELQNLMTIQKLIPTLIPIQTPIPTPTQIQTPILTRIPTLIPIQTPTQIQTPILIRILIRTMTVKCSELEEVMAQRFLELGEALKRQFLVRDVDRRPEMVWHCLVGFLA